MAECLLYTIPLTCSLQESHKTGKTSNKRTVNFKRDLPESYGKILTERGVGIRYGTE